MVIFMGLIIAKLGEKYKENDRERGVKLKV
jgi:hypothetical protein